MKESTKGNIYNASERTVRELYADYVSGPASTLVCALSNHPLGAAAREAVEKSMAALGYGSAVTFATLSVDDIALSVQDLFVLVEGIDPIAVIATDEMSAHALSKAHRGEIRPDAAGRLFGRDVVAFRNLEGMLDTPDKKQRAWQLFKKLPKLK